MTENRVFLEESSNPNYLAMYQNAVEELNRMDEHEVPEATENFVLAAFPDIDPSEIIGAELVDYEPEEIIPSPEVVTNDHEEPQLLEL